MSRLSLPLLLAALCLTGCEKIGLSNQVDTFAPSGELLSDSGGQDESPLLSEGRSAGECSDGADNDGDGLYDCDDPDCFGSPDCDYAEGQSAGDCSDGADNDGDGTFTEAGVDAAGGFPTGTAVSDTEAVLIGEF